MKSTDIPCLLPKHSTPYQASYVERMDDRNSLKAKRKVNRHPKLEKRSLNHEKWRRRLQETKDRHQNVVPQKKIFLCTSVSPLIQAENFETPFQNNLCYSYNLTTLLTVQIPKENLCGYRSQIPTSSYSAVVQHQFSLKIISLIWRNPPNLYSLIEFYELALDIKHLNLLNRIHLLPPHFKF